MHSALQAELRLTQRIIRSSCCHCAKRCQSPKRSFHQGRSLRASQGARSDVGSISAVSPAEEKGESQNAHHPALQRQVTDHAASQTPTNASNGVPPSEDSDPAQLSSYYGSVAKRRLRTRNLKESPEPTESAPEWFVENNVRLWSEGNYGSRPPSIELVNPDAALDRPDEPISAGPPNTNGPEDQSALRHESAEVSQNPEGLVDVELKDGNSEHAVDPGKKYYVESKQWEELLRSARGMLRAPERREYQFEPAIAASVLLVHYAGRDGDLLLDDIIHHLSTLCTSSIVTLDAQDIGELISKSPQQAETAFEGRMLGYSVPREVYDRLDAGNLRHKFPPSEDAEDEMDEPEQFDFPSAASSRGMPMIVGKPITIDLSQFFGPRQSPGRLNRSMTTDQFFSDAFQGAASKSRSQSQPFANVVEKVLSALPGQQVSSLEPGSRAKAEAEKLSYTKNAAIIHVKDLKAIQEYPVGKQFLSQLYDQVQRRRNAGESILIIGTDCAHHDSPDYRPTRIHDLQILRRDEVSRTIVLTPVLPNTTSRLALLQDRKKRIATINLRNLWEMFRYKSSKNFLDMKPGFWRTNILDQFTPQDVAMLELRVYGFDFVHRLATFIQGYGPDQSYGPNVDEGGPAALFFPIISTSAARLAASDSTKTKWAEDQAKSAKPDTPDHLKSSEDPRLAKIRASATKHEKRLMGGVIEADRLSTTFDDVHVPVDTIDALQTLTTLSLVRPEAFKYGVLASDKIPGLLLYGPPGTGKTLLAKAVAKESGATVLEVSGADINDMYVGEGEKNVKALFSLAKKLSPCIVFLDEADAMFSARSAQGRRVSHRELLNQFLKEWDGMSNDAGSAFIMVATNRPMDLDDAVLRRLPRRLLVDLPSEQDRLEILKIHLRQEHLAEDVDLPSIAKKTPFYSGSDLKNVAVAAALSAVREEHEVAKKHKGDETYKFPEKRTLTAKHFEKALDDISASISEDMTSLRDIKKFDEQYGDKRGKKRRAPKWGFRTATEADEVLDTVKVRS